jgi:hypothetical protein
MVEYHWLQGQFDRLPAVVADLVRRRVDVIAMPAFRAGAPAAKATRPSRRFRRVDRESNRFSAPPEPRAAAIRTLLTAANDLTPSTTADIFISRSWRTRLGLSKDAPLPPGCPARVYGGGDDLFRVDPGGLQGGGDFSLHAHCLLGSRRASRLRPEAFSQPRPVRLRQFEQSLPHQFQLAVIIAPDLAQL